MESIDTGTRWGLYEQEFGLEMSRRPDIVLALDRITIEIESENYVIITCFCSNYKRCHSGLIGKEISGRGLGVIPG